MRPTLLRRFRGGARRVSPVDFTRPCRRAAAATPPVGSVVTRGERNLLPSPSARGLGPRIGSIEATCAFTSVAARQLACRSHSGFVDGLQLIRFPSWLPSKLRGFWFLPRWVYLPLSVLAFWSYKLTKPGQNGASQLISSVRRTVAGSAGGEGVRAPGGGRSNASRE